MKDVNFVLESSVRPLIFDKQQRTLGEMNFFIKNTSAITEEITRKRIAELSLDESSASAKRQRNETVEHDAKSDSLTITAAKRTDWTSNPTVFNSMHEIVKQCNYSMRSAAKIINAKLFPTCIPRQITASTLQNWYERTANSSYQLASKYIQYLNLHSAEGRENSGRPTIFAKYPAYQTEICQMLSNQRRAGIPLNSWIARELIYSYLYHHQFPELTEFGGSFTVSRRWVRQFLSDICLCSYRKATKSAQHLPNDWQNQCEHMVQRIAILADEFKIPQQFIVNIDQTGINLVPSSVFSYDISGNRDCSVLGKNDKRQITAVVGVSASSELLPLQLIYAGKNTANRAQPDEIHKIPLLRNGFSFAQTPSHWSSVRTHKMYVNEILVPFFMRQCEEMKLSYFDQHFILIVDVWHRDKDWLEFMSVEYPRIHLVFVPGGCTGEIQPCDVFIQRPFKHALLTQFSQWAAQQVLNELAKGTCAIDVKLDFAIGSVRDQSCAWILVAWSKIKSMKSMMMDGWAKKCKITNRIYDEVFILRAKLAFSEQKWSRTCVYVPMGRVRLPPLENGSASHELIAPSDEEQSVSCYSDEFGEDEEETTENVMQECLNDEAIAEMLQAEEDDR